jgi:hypothetical protein
MNTYPGGQPIAPFGLPGVWETLGFCCSVPAATSETAIAKRKRRDETEAVNFILFVSVVAYDEIEL